MHHGNAINPATDAPSNRGWSRLRGILLRKLWLPRFIYEILPYLYIAGGLVALGSAMYTPDWTILLPWAILVGLICLHAGVVLVALRYRFRQQKDADPESKS